MTPVWRTESVSKNGPAEHPRVLVGQQQPLAAARSHQLLVEWNDTAVDRSTRACVHLLVEALAAAAPDRIALVFEQASLTYGELNDSANRLAHYLRGLGVGPETLVGLVLERCLDLPVAMLAILKAGGGFVPLDPGLPAERMAFTVDDARLTVLVSERRLADRLPPGPEGGQRIVLLDADAPAIAECPRGGLEAGAHAESPCHLFYTSGSTGTPKGPVTTHRGLHNQMLWLRETFALGAGDRVLHKTPISFNVSAWEIFWALTSGAGLVIARPGGHQDAAYMADLIASRRVTTLHFVPSMLRIFLDQPIGKCRVLKRLITSGEALPADLQQQLHARLGPEHYNMYGATEAPRVCLGPVDPGSDRSPVPLGRPTTNSRVYALDSTLRPVAKGEAGELCLGGLNLGRGYLRQAALTAAAFVPDPFAAGRGEPGARLYKTGDLGRRLADGRVQFVGRADHQVQVRGMRVELGEIERVLEEHRWVDRALVLLRQDVAGDSRLVAYVVLDARSAPAGGEVIPRLRAHLAERLPEYMVPASYLCLDALPLNTSGKVDRQALPAPGPERPQLEARYVAPRGEVEQRLAAIWAEVLGLDRVGADDNFFHLGGHSLLATRAVSRVRQTLGRELPLRSLFEAPTVAGAARQLTEVAPRPSLPAIAVADRRPGAELALSFAQQRLWFVDRLAPGNPFYNVPVSWILRGPLSVAALAGSLNEILRRHEALRTRFPERQGRPSQAVSPFRGRPLPVVDLGALSIERARREARRLATAEAIRPFDLRSGPVLRWTLVRLAGDEAALLVTMHHIVADGWSLGVLLGELASLYETLEAVRPSPGSSALSTRVVSPLAELAVQYADFASWQRGWLAGEVLAEQLSYWREQLARAPAFELPTDRPRPEVQTFHGRKEPFEIPRRLTRALASMSQRQGVTLFMTLLATFKALLYRITSRSDLIVGSPIANRGVREIESLIGFFVNNLVLRSRLTGGDRFTRLLARVRETALAAYSHQDLPFEKLVEHLQPDRDLSRNPLFQVVFALQNAPRPALEMGHLTLYSLPFEVRTTRFDLEVHLWERPEGLLGALYYDRDLFDRTTMTRFHRHFAALLDSVAERPERRLADLALLSPVERHQMLVEWNADEGSTAARSTAIAETWVQERVESFARRQGDSLALVHGGRCLTYRELDARAGRLARRLRALGVEAAAPLVAVCLERGVEMVLSQLAVLKAGGAFLSLDPAYPERRLRFMLEDSRPRVLIAQGLAVSLRGDWRVLDPATETSSLLRASGATSRRQAGGPTRSATAADLAYVIYTSGSTGVPKGVETGHRGLVNLVRWYRRVFEIVPGDRMTQVAGPGFDASVYEIWNCLAAGATLHLVDEETRASAPAVVDWLATLRIDVCWLPTPLAEAALQEPWPPGMALRTLQTAGDRLHASALKPLPARLFNLYGPTEATVLTTWAPIDAGSESLRDPPIGRPMRDVQVYVLDSGSRPVPIGAIGEIAIGGTSLAQGYLGRPGRTAERFVPDDRTSDGRTRGARLYRTGDLGRFLAGGEIEFLGRIDDQVKVRGWRVELGEIESQLGRHPALRQAAVVARPGAGGETRIVAFVVESPEAADIESARSRAAAEAEQVGQWQSLYDQAYEESPSPGDDSGADNSDNFVGWNSSYTDEPIPAEEMRQWAESTADRIRSRCRRADASLGRVLELGCGTGLLLLRLAAGCERYVGRDFSARALAYLERRVAARGLPQVELRRALADDFSGLGEGDFDVVILNSVVQYFPSVHYLLEVLEQAVRRLAPGGVLFLGDLRSLALHRAYCASVELHRAADEDSAAELAERVRQRAMNDEELLLDADFFAALQRHLPRLGELEILPRRGHAHNELTRFRYDAILRLDPPPEAVEPRWLDWRHEGLTLKRLRARLETSRPRVLALTGVPNARLRTEAMTLEWLDAAARGARDVHPEGVPPEEDKRSVVENAGELRRRLRRAWRGTIDPHELWQWSAELPYEVDVTWGRPAADGRFDVVFRRRAGDGAPAAAPCRTTRAALRPAEPWTHYANDPLSGQSAARLIPELRRYLAQRLPEPMVPSAFVVMAALPLTPNGKVDRAALEALPESRRAAGDAFRAPRTAVEQTLAGIWSELLGSERIGLDDDFFDLGGHSLLATQVVSRVRKALGVELPLRVFFQHPTVAELAGACGDPGLDQEDVPLALLRGDGEAGGEGPSRSLPPIRAVPRSDDGALPLSFAQQRLWFLDRLVTDNPFYIVAMAWTLEGPLDVAVLERSLGEVLRRHEVLRTRFVERGKEPVQVIDAYRPQSLAVVDLRRLDDARRQAEASRLATREARRPFDLARDRLLRTALLRLTDAEAVLLLTTHHIAADGWSVWVLLRDLAAYYRAFRARRSVPRVAAGQGAPRMGSRLPELPVQYADFAVWQRTWLQGDVLAEHLRYWRRQLTGLTVLELPTDRPRPAVQVFRGQRATYSLSRSLADALRAVGQEQGATLFMTVLAAFQALLHRLTHQDDVVVGSPIANRNHLEIEQLIGFFVNSLAMRGRPNGRLRFRDLLAQAREAALGAYTHQDLPFEMLVEHLHPQRDLSRNPIFQVSFALQNAPRAATRMGEVTLHALPFETRTTRFDVEAHLRESPEGLVGMINYDRDLFDATTIRRWIGHFRTLLQAVADDPMGRLSELPLLSRGQRSQLEVEWSARQDSGPGPTLSALFKARVRSHPDAVALTLVDEGRIECLTYGELARRAEQLAHALRRLGIGAEVPVALLMDRSLEMVVAIVGILETGGFYVPLDPSHPRERLAFTLEDAGAEILLTREAELSRVPAGSVPSACHPGGGPKILCLDRQWPEIAAAADATSVDLEPGVDPHNTAYLIYTSGSTGQPKGTPVSHRNVTRLFAATEDWLGDSADLQRDVWTLFHSYAFDFSVWELWGALLYGGRLVVVPHWISRSPADFRRLLAEERVTILNQTPSAFRQLVQAERGVPSRDLALRLVIFGGEALERSDVAPWFERHGDGVRLVNMYGITETTVHVTYRPLRPVDARSSARSPIGVALPDLGLYLRDPAGTPVPQGVPGEIFVAGGGLARGYLRRPALTAERFVPNPFGTRPGDRLYRTGDLARWLGDGGLEFLGRIDHQVKIRGFRVELGEIGAVLAEHPAVRESVVLARRPEVAGEAAPSLVAYAVVDREAGSTGLATARQDQVGQWGVVFDDLYTRPPADDPTFNIAGWDSRITGRPIPAAEMAEWLDDTVRSILALRPRRVLEIGCGTGMLLFRVAPHCEHYLGTDLSPQALAYVERHLPAIGEAADRVSLAHGAATAILADGAAAGGFDTVVLNSVVQYFPSIDDLVEVVAAALDALPPEGGRIFLGDLRSLPLLETFHAEVELAAADDALPLARLRQRLRLATMKEEELVVDPAFFAALRDRMPRIDRVEIFPKQGRHHNELTCFRYQVVLHCQARAAAEAADGEWLDWQREGLSLDELSRLLVERAPAVLALTAVPNARVERQVRALELLRAEGDDQPAADRQETVGALRRRLAAEPRRGVDPSEVWALAEELPYEVRLSWARHGRDGSFDVLLTRRDSGMRRSWPAVEVSHGLPWSAYASDPLPGAIARQLVPELRSLAASKLPEHMVPASYVLLDALPLTANGKLDRDALPAPESSRPELRQGYVAPRDGTEESLAGIWAAALGLDRVGVEDDFFDLGGHSLLATQVVAQIRRLMAVEVPLRTLFEARTVARLAGRLSASRPRSRPPLRPLERPRSRDDLRLSFAQQRLWFLDRLSPGNPFYLSPVIWRLRGPLDIGLLERCLDRIVRRHEVLRTAYPSRGGQPSQKIAEALTLRAPRIDLRALKAGARRTELRRLAVAEATRPLDPGFGPVLRASTVRLGERETILFLTPHHIAWDGWSLAVLRRELTELYEAAVAGRQASLPRLDAQYADFAAWQRRWLRGEVLAEQLRYWRGQLAEVPVLELPTDRPRPAVRAFRGRGQRCRLDAELTSAIDALGRRGGATLFMTLLAGFTALLERYSGQDDVVVGSPIAGRQPETENLIGFFVNTLALLARPRGALTFDQFLEQVKETALQAYAHQDVPFEKLVEHLEGERDLSRNPIFQVLMALQIAPPPEDRMADLTVHPVPVEVRTARFDLELNLQQRPDGLVGWLIYDADLFDAATIQRLGRHFRTLLKGIPADPARRLSDLPLLTAAERQQLTERNDAASELPREVPIDRLFESWVERQPHAPAVVLGERSLTYRQLDRRADRLARWLRGAGGGPDSGALQEHGAEVLVGLCVEDWIEMVVATLGILKAGGAYVPLDPSYPAARLDYMVRDTGMPVIVTQRHLVASLPESDARRVCLEDVAAAPDELVASPAALQATTLVSSSATTGEHLVYVMYTSGSTGQPKGVAITHRGVSRLVKNTNYARIRPADRVAQVSNVAFDAATFEIWGALLNGACLVGIPKSVVLSPLAFATELERREVNVLHLTPALFNQMTREAPRAFSRLRYLLFGGESGDPRRVRQALAEGAPGRLLHFYGPTESTTFATWQHLRAVAQGDSLPIGRPVANTTLRVVDRHRRPVPIGVAGELLIGGEGLARGYFRRPAWTAERFVPDPWSAAGGERFYRTGDLVRTLAGGELEFLGRFDHQVKIRGYRIELGEIETVLGEHPAVREAVVLALRQGDAPSARLLAWVVPTPGLAVAGLRAFLADRLPDYMLPAAFLEIESLPLTANGKIDRTALARSAPRRLVAEHGAAGADPVPRTPQQDLLAAIWSEVLDVEQIGVDDDFFEIGGHSLLATRVVSQIRRAFQVELPLRAVFEASTLAELAERITAATRSRPLPPIRPSDEPSRALSFAQQRLWFLDRLSPGNAFYNVPVNWCFRGRLDLPALAASLDSIRGRHDVQRSRYPSREGQPVQEVSEARPEPLPVIDLTALGPRRRQAARRLATEEIARPFDLGTGPLMRATLLWLGNGGSADDPSSACPAGEAVLLLSLHHIVSDGWSVAVLRRELSALYPAALAGRPSPLPPLSIQYRDFARWQRRWLRGEVLAEQLGYWRRQLEAAPLLELPTDRPRPAVQRHRGRIARFEVAAETTAALRSLSREHRVTLFMTLLAAFKALLHRLSGQDDLVVGSPIANRTRAEVEGLIGFFVNSLALRSRPHGGLAFAEFLLRVREVALGAYAHQDLPFEKLVEELQPERDLSRNPIYQVMFALLDGPELSWKLPQVEVERFDTEIATANFDLNVTLVETGGGRLLGFARYDSDLFEATTIRRLMGCFDTLIEGVARAPETHLGALPLLPTAQRHQLLVEWNATAGVAAAGGTTAVHQLFELQAARRPYAPALVFEGEELSYRQLDRRAERLAAELRASGLAPEDRVAILLERSAEMAIAILAVMKAGGAYVPLDPGFPHARLELMVAAAGARILLAGERLQGMLDLPGVSTLVLDGDRQLDLPPVPRPAAGKPLRGTSPEGSLAYAIFTSGSTGEPKGVAIEHRQLRDYAFGVLEHLDLGPGSASFATVSTLATDLGNTAIFPALCSGGCLHVISELEVADPEALEARFHARPVDCLKIVPSHLEALLSGAHPERVLPRRRLILGGEAAGPRLLDRVRALAPGCRIVNHYGPTETTVGATACRVAEAEARPPIGRPLAQARTFVLDAALRPVPAGAPGELAIGGSGLARGYLGRPASTAARFIPDPFGRPGGRLYRTGDLARHRADGRIDFLGRVDQQVKIRGFRIEPGEIEAALRAHPAVDRAVVLARANGEAGESAGDRRLIAYFTPGRQVDDARDDDARDDAAGDLRRHLAARLPDYMVPSSFVELAELPLNATGKVDRRALPAVAAAATEVAVYRAPSSPTEETLADLWAEVLKRERVGVDENFFDLGGHSLLATRLISKMRRVFSMELPLRAIFETPTVEGLARQVDTVRWAAGDAGVRPTAATAEERPPAEDREELVL